MYYFPELVRLKTAAVRYLVALYLSLTSLTAATQDLSGTWEEESETRFTSYTKVCIAKFCDEYIAYTYDRDNEGGYCKTILTILFNQKRREFRGEGISFEYRTTGHVLAVYDLNYRTKKGDEYLQGLIYMKPHPDSIGRYTFRDSLERDLGRPEFIQIIKTSNRIDSSDYMKLAALKPCKKDTVIVTEPAMVHAPAPEEKKIEQPVKETERPVADTVFVAEVKSSPLELRNQRYNDTISVNNIIEKELTIRVMDNAITDGDTISIIHNGKLIAERILVSAKPFPVTIQLSKEDPYHELILVAHNLGSIPPNTALLLISYGNKEVRLHAIADLSKNALIVFRYTGD